MKRVICLSLALCTLLTLSLHAANGFQGTTPSAGTSYYLFNVYQQKFLSYGNAWGTQVSLDNKNPLLCTLEASGSGYIINTHFDCDANGYVSGINNYVCVVSGIPVVNANYGSGNANLRSAQTWNLTEVDDGYNITYTDGVTKALMFEAGSACTVDTLSKSFFADKSIWRFIPVDEYETYKNRTRFTMAALNVDGMPQSIKIAGVYTLTLNSDAKEEAGATAIGHKLKTMGWDVIGVSEDFNYHSYIWNQAWNGGVNNAPDSLSYNATTHRGGISVTASTYTKYLSSTSPLFDTDGLCLFYKTSNVGQSTLESSESWTAWSTHNGYTDQGADGMIDKGYRYYTVKLADGTEIDLYILHMDAEDGTADNAARATQLTQLANAIKATNNGRPVIVMGDTNCRYTRDNLKSLFIDAINADSRFTIKDTWVEFGRGGAYPTYGSSAIMASTEGYRKGEVVDKMFYINNTQSDIRISPITYAQDLSFINDAGEPLADHWPAVGEFEYHTYDPLVDDVVTENLDGTYYLRNKETRAFLKAGGWWGTHAVQGDYGKAIALTQLSNGKYDLNGVTQNDPYMDGTGATWTLVQEGNYYSFTYDDNGTTKALTGNDPTYFPDEPGPNTRYVTCAVFDANDNYQKWELLTKEDLIDEMQYATASNPYNATFLLKDANFDRNDADGSGSWTNTITSDAARMTSNLCDGKNDFAFGNSVAEVFVSSWSKTSSPTTTWDINQALSNLPNGTYKITCQAFQRISNSTSTTATIQLYAKGSSEVSTQVKLMYGNADITDSSFGGTTQSGSYYYPNSMAEATLYFNAGYYVNTVDNVSVTDGTMTVGIRKTSTTGKSYTAWTCFDNFQLYYYPTETYLRGDLNNDKQVSLRDIPMLVDYLNGNTSPYNHANSDVNADHQRNVKDVEKLSEMILSK